MIQKPFNNFLTVILLLCVLICIPVQVFSQLTESKSPLSTNDEPIQRSVPVPESDTSVQRDKLSERSAAEMRFSTVIITTNMLEQDIAPKTPEQESGINTTNSLMGDDFYRSAQTTRTLPSISPILSEYHAHDFYLRFGDHFRMETGFRISKALENANYLIKLDLRNRESHVTNNTQTTIPHSAQTFYDMGFELMGKTGVIEAMFITDYLYKNEGLYYTPIAGLNLLSRCFEMSGRIRFRKNGLQLLFLTENEFARMAAGQDVLSLKYNGSLNTLSMHMRHSELYALYGELYYNGAQIFDSTKRGNLHRGGASAGIHTEIARHFDTRIGLGFTGSENELNQFQAFLYPDVYTEYKRFDVLRFFIKADGINNFQTYKNFSFKTDYTGSIFPRSEDNGYRFSSGFTIGSGTALSCSISPYFEYYRSRNEYVLNSYHMLTPLLRRNDWFFGTSLTGRLSTKNISWKTFVDYMPVQSEDFSHLAQFSADSSLKIFIMDINAHILAEVNIIRGIRVQNLKGNYLSAKDMHNVNAGIEKHIKPGLAFSFLIKNIFDTPNELVPGIPQSGRIFYAGTSLEF